VGTVGSGLLLFDVVKVLSWVEDIWIQRSPTLCSA
jgi:hypothetical protein